MSIISTAPTEEEKQMHAREGWDLIYVNREVHVSSDLQDVTHHVRGVVVSLTYHNPDTGETKIAPVLTG